MFQDNEKNRIKFRFSPQLIAGKTAGKRLCIAA
jgi:hypothetical protein